MLRFLISCLLLSMVSCGGNSAPPPNILFVILDDVGIDQMSSFGYGGVTPARTPIIDALAQSGVRFRNVWATPECSPSRASFFVGRYPQRTDIYSAILNLDLANSQVSPNETTLPRILKAKNYESGLFGKFHLGGPENNPNGNLAPHGLGWDYFYGYIQGGPYPLDVTAGGGDVSNGSSCGFVKGQSTGACYQASGSCSDMTTFANNGQTCLENGGIFVPGVACQSQLPANLNFSTYNGYYVSPLVINDSFGALTVVPSDDMRARTYRTTVETNGAIDWINSRVPGRPWMATVSFSAAHSPFQQPPAALLPTNTVANNGLDCAQVADQRVLMNQMVEAADHEIGRLLVAVGLATWDTNGNFQYQPGASNTMIVLIGDNGSFAPTVKAPFVPTKAKATVYQTGVWVPMLVAGPLVQSPGRDDNHLVNGVDLFQLFGEIAGIDVHQSVPVSHALDSQSLLPYLTNPQQPAIRSMDFTQTGQNIKPAGTPIPPCVLQSFNTCVQLFTGEGLCAANGGIWYGPGNATKPAGYADCCEVINDPALNMAGVAPLPISQQAVRDDLYKLVVQTVMNCTTASTNVSTEFYQFDTRAINPMLDQTDLLAGQGDAGRAGLDPVAVAHYDQLTAELMAKMSITPSSSCLGDGNLDKVVDAKDVAGWQSIVDGGGLSSWYDFNHDGFTDGADLTIIQQNMGRLCAP
ncbi:MAG: sulfatase-like hydrolase/transferase [Zetaproteobacteria bacterium]|nr:sulfatase-like hydrolase/transferase [Zetaproteobacteria bacterium]